MEQKNKSNLSQDDGRVHNRNANQKPAGIYLNGHLHLTRAVVITAILLVFLALLPAYIRTALWHGLHSHPILSSLLLCFALLALSLLWSTGERIDAWAFLAFNFRGKRPLWLDRMMLGVTQLGAGWVSFLAAVIFFWAGNYPLGYELILGTITLWLLVEAMKAIIRRKRPYIKLIQTRIVGARPRGRSFPSGHTTQSFFTTTLLVQHFHPPTWAAVLLYILALLVGVTRMYVGAHYPRDVMAGAILGSVWGALGVISDIHFFEGLTQFLAIH